MKHLLVALTCIGVLAGALCGCRSVNAPPPAGPIPAGVPAPTAASWPTQPAPAPSPSLRPPGRTGWRTAGLEALPEPPSEQLYRPEGVTLIGLPGRVPASGSKPQNLALLEPGVPGPVPSARAQYALMERVARSEAGAAARSAALRPPAVAAAAGRPAASAAAAGKPAQAAQAPAGQGKTSSSAPGVPAAATKQAPSAATGAATTPREVLARAGDPVEITFDGRGWLFLGVSNADPGRSPGVIFQGGGSIGGRSVFSFKALENGQYTLRFQLQDNQTGRALEEALRLSVLPEREFAARLQGQTRLPATAAAEDEQLDPERLAMAERWFSLGEYDRAVAAFLEEYREGDAHLNDRVAASYAATGEHLAAEKYYRRNLQAAEPFASQAVAGLVRAAVATGDSALLLEQFPALMRSQELPVGRELLEVGRSQARAGFVLIAQEALQEYLRRYPAGESLDEACYLLARILEAESPARDLRRARDLYQRVYEEFPESPFAAAAQGRRDYLNRHFFQVR